MNLTNTKKYDGYSSELVYEKDNLQILRGRGSRLDISNIRVINISLSLHGVSSIEIDLWEGHRFYDPMLRLLEQSVRDHADLLKQVWKAIVALGDPKEIFDEVFEVGRKQGREEKVKEIRKSLDLEWEIL